MQKSYTIFEPTDLTRDFDKLNLFLYLFGMKGYWLSEVKLPKAFVTLFDKYLLLSNVWVLSLIASNCASFFTQTDLTDTELSDLVGTSLVMPLSTLHYITFEYYKEEVKDILYNLIVVLKEHYHDRKSGKELIFKIKLYIGVLFIAVTGMTLERGLSGIVKKILYDETFRPFITAWPDVHDTSMAGFIVRLIYYIGVFSYVMRNYGTVGMTATLLLATSYQFKNLQLYFYSINDIFEDNPLNQEEKEQQYEAAFKLGIRLHALSLDCVRRVQRVCNIVFCSTLVVNMCFIVMVLPALVISDTLTGKLPYLLELCGDLTILSIIMWNAGNITAEAENVSHAMYASGWHNCHGASSVRVRRLLVIAMMYAQQPVVISVFGVVEMSYANFVTVVKTSYSVYSVFSTVQN